MRNLRLLHAEYGQSPWLDNLTRSQLRDGTLQRMISDGIRGVTANPTIIAKASHSNRWPGPARPVDEIVANRGYSRPLRSAPVHRLKAGAKAPVENNTSTHTE